jgi:gamma-glutamylcyclotransferase (GGCT)/AIG2-like uncharacterized protein YtfP
MSDYLFVYGTLLPPFVPAALREVAARLRPAGPAWLPGRLYDLGAYPGAVAHDEGGRVRGEVFVLPDETALLARLDAYEGFDPADPVGSLFVRVRHEPSLEDGRTVTAWVYVYNCDPGNAPRILCGDYAAWRTRDRAR